jgi:hypothetical protein
VAVVGVATVVATGFLSWDAVSGASGYNVYWGTVGGPPYANVVDVGNVTSADQGDFAGLGTGTRYFNIRSYDESMLEGPWGAEITVTVT